MSDYLLTEAGDTLVTERGNNIELDVFEVCDWPTLAVVKSTLGIATSTDDVYIQRQMDITENEIENYLGRYIPMQVQTDTIRGIECNKAFGFTSSLQLKRWPVTEIIEIEGDDELLDIDTVIQYEGLLSGDFSAYDKVEVKYHGGMCPIPYELVEVFYSIVQAKYESKDNSSTHQEIRKRTIPNVITEEFYAPDRYSQMLVSTYSGTLDRYKALYV